MHKFFTLTRITLKNTIGMVSDGKSKSRNTILLYLFLFICLIPLAFMFYVFFQTIFEASIALDQSGAALALAFHASCLVTFYFSIFLIPGIFYFSKDGETLLSLPLSPQSIMGSKFVVALIYEYAFSTLIMLPILLAYINTIGVNVLFIIFAILILLCIPIYPLVLSSLISMLIMRFVPFFKNRDRFNLISGILAIGTSIGLNVYLNTSVYSQDSQMLINLLLDGNNSFIQMFAYLFPAIPFASKALIGSDFLQLLMFLVIHVLALSVFMFAGKYLYFKGLIGFSETGTNHKKLSDQDYNKMNHQKNRVLTYTMKELKLLFRTPIYFMNCIGSSIIFPTLIFVLPYLKMGDSISSLKIPNEFLHYFTEFWPYVIFAGIIMGIFVSNLNLISSTSISREGENIGFMKYIPMPLHLQLHAKALSGILISIFTSMLMLVAMYLLLPGLPIVIAVLVFISSLVGIVLGNYIGLLIDIVHPKLVWEQEATAVKQNMAGFVAMMGGIALAAAMGFVAYLIPYEMISYGAIGILLFMIILSVILYKSIAKIAQKAFAKY